MSDPQVFSSCNNPTARKDHRCCECHGVIRKGEKYHHHPVTAKWFWKMDYCKKHGLAPAQNWMWDIAEAKWQQAQSPNAKVSDPAGRTEIKP